MTAVLAVLAAALIVGWRRTTHPRTPSRRQRSGVAGVGRQENHILAGPRAPRRGRRTPALLLVAALLGGLTLVGAPAVAAPTQPFDCQAPPEPDRPGTGLVGSLDPAPIGVGVPGSVYDEVGYAGQIWWTYDLGCGPGGARDPAAATDTWLGNEIFDVAKVIVAGVNWAHYLIARGSGLLAPLDGIVASGTRAMYEAVFTTWAGVALAVLAAVLLALAVRGELAAQARRVGVAVIALALAAAAYAAPVSWSSALDGLLLDGATAMQQGFLDRTGAGGVDTLPTVLSDQVVYTTWLRGEYGAADVPQALASGRDLLRAQTFTKAEVATGRDTAADAEAKKARFGEIADAAGDRYPYLQGRAGSRVGAGVLALVQAVAIGLFQLLAKVLVLVSMLLVRLLVMTAPVLAVVALLRPSVLAPVLRVGGAALVNTLLVGALAGLHSLMVVSLFRPGSGVDTWLALLVTAVVTVVLWAVTRPFRRLAAMVSLTRDELGGVLPAAGRGLFGGRGAEPGAAWGPPVPPVRAEGADGPAAAPAPRTATRTPVRVDAEVVRPSPAARPALLAGESEPVLYRPVGAGVGGSAPRGRGVEGSGVGGRGAGPD